MSTEGSNPEVDACGWPMDTTQQQWRLEDHNGATRIISARRGLCLTLADDLEIYSGPLHGGRATAVLFNRSPSPAAMTFDFADVPGLDGTGKVAVRDQWAHKDLG